MRNRCRTQIIISSPRRTKPAQISCHVLWDAIFKPFSYALRKYSMQSCRIRHFNLTIKLFWFHCVLFFIKKLFDPSSVAIEKSWTIIGDEDDKSKTIANYRNVWCVEQTCTLYGSIRRLKKSWIMMLFWFSKVIHYTRCSHQEGRRGFGSFIGGTII